MTRIEILTEAIIQAWLNGEPDGLLRRELVKAHRGASQ